MRAATLGASLSLAVAALVGAPQVGLLAEDGGNGTGHPSWLQLAPASTGLADGDEQPLPLPEHFAFFEESKLAAAAFDPFSRDAPSVGGRFVRAEAAAPPAIVYAAAAPSGPIEPGITGCLSHDLFNDMQNAMNPLATRTHVALTVGQSKTAKYQATQLSFMIILLLLSIVVLLAPLLSMNSVVGVGAAARAQCSSGDRKVHPCRALIDPHHRRSYATCSSSTSSSRAWTHSPGTLMACKPSRCACSR